MPLEAADLGRLRDMVDYAREAIQLLGQLGTEQLIADRRTFLAVSRCVEVVGEASWKLSAELKEAHTDVPWPLIAGMRHRLVHDYGRVDCAIIHRVIVDHLPELVRQIQSILDQAAS